MAVHHLQQLPHQLQQYNLVLDNQISANSDNINNNKFFLNEIVSDISGVSNDVSNMKVGGYINILNEPNCTDKDIKATLYNCMHLNVRSLRNKAPELEIFVNSLENSSKPQILCLTESWLTNTESKMEWVAGYKIISAFCRNKLGYGGSCIMVQESLIKFCDEKVTLKNLSEEGIFECSAIEVTLNKITVMYISLYRPPNSNVESFFHKLEMLLTQIYKQNINKKIVLCGDLNIDYSTNNSNKQKLENILLSYNLENKLKAYTHFTANSATAIDYVIGGTNMNITVLNTDPGLTDHYAQLVKIMLNEVLVKKEFITKNVRIYSQRNYNYFNSRLASEQWLEISERNNVNDNYNMFINTFMQYFEESFPTTIHYIKADLNKTFHKPGWISQGIIKSSKKLKELYELKKTSNDKNFIEYYKTYKKTYSKVLKVAKKKFTSERIRDCINKPGEVWKIINNKIGNKTPKSKQKIEIKINDTLITSEKDIANAFNCHYVNISSKLNCNVYPPQINKLNMIKYTQNKAQFVLYPTNEGEIIKAIKSLKNKKSQDIHGLSNILVKSCYKNILHPLKLIINQSFNQGIFPDRLKIAKVQPIYKKGDRDKLENYRPISLLPVFSKIFERILHNRLTKYLESNKIICREQSGFQKNKSTMTAVFQLTKSIVEALDKGELAYGIFCDLSKAFDLVDHNTLLEKLKNTGIINTALAIFKSYLLNRKQIVEMYNGDIKVASKWETIKTGVPQGSILGPLLFLIYVNDLPENVKTGTITLFADDTSIIVRESNIDTLRHISNTTLKTLENWFRINQMVLNVEKTKYLHFQKQHTGNDCNKILCNYNNSIIEEAKIIKFLGLNIDERLSWSEHIKILEKKLSSVCYMLRALKLVLDIETLRMVYFAFFHSVMKYGLEFWGNASRSKNIFILQKKVIRIIAGVNKKTSCKPLFLTHQIKTMYIEYVIQALKLIKLNIECYPKNENIHQHNTRNSHKLRNIQHTSSLFEKSLYYSGLRMYNNLPKHISQEMNIKKFNKFIHDMFDGQCFYSIQEVENYLKDL